MAKSGWHIARSPARSGRPAARDRIFSEIVPLCMARSIRESQQEKKGVYFSRSLAENSWLGLDAHLHQHRLGKVAVLGAHRRDLGVEGQRGAFVAIHGVVLDLGQRLAGIEGTQGALLDVILE